MKVLFKCIFSVLVLVISLNSEAGRFIDNNQTCIDSKTNSTKSMKSVSGPTCKKLVQYKEIYEIAAITMMPASVAIASSKIPTINSLLVALGLSNPAVVSLTVIGTAGVAVVYVVLKQTYKDCEKLAKEDLKKELLLEIEQNYGIRKISDSIPFTKIPN